MKKRVHIFGILSALAVLILFTSCGPKRAEVKFHVDQDVYIKTVIIAETTSSISIDVFEEHRDLNLKKGDIVTYSVPQGHYDFYIYVDRNLSPNYDFTNKDPLTPYFRLTCETTDEDELDIYFSDASYGYSINK